MHILTLKIYGCIYVGKVFYSVHIVIYEAM